VQMVAAVVNTRKASGMGGIAYDLFEVHDTVQVFCDSRQMITRESLHSTYWKSLCGLTPKGCG
jgi:hypothetical protein